METPEVEPPYPNAPVQEVVFEIRFPGEPAVECKRDQFFERVRAELPEVHVPKLQQLEGQAVALMPYGFRSADGSRSILTALNQFAFASSKYPGYAVFSAEALRWLTEFVTMFKITKLTRTGLRYVNVIPIIPESPVNDLLKVEVNLGQLSDADGPSNNTVRNLALNVELRRPGGVLNMRLGRLEGSEQPQLVLDFDYVKTQNLTIANIRNYLRESHDETKRLFEGLLTDSYRAYLKGEVVE